jgi:hypothetical protein
MSWRLLVDGVATTRSRTTRRVRPFDRNRGSHPDREEGGDWKQQGAGELRPLVVLLVSLREISTIKHQEKSPERGKGRREEKGKRGSLETPNFAGDARRNEELRRAICAAWRRNRERERGEEERRGRPSYSRVLVAN